jgi:hypothetical protein
MVRVRPFVGKNQRTFTSMWKAPDSKPGKVVRLFHAMNAHGQVSKLKRWLLPYGSGDKRFRRANPCCFLMGGKKGLVWLMVRTVGALWKENVCIMYFYLICVSYEAANCDKISVRWHFNMIFFSLCAAIRVEGKSNFMEIRSDIHWIRIFTHLRRLFDGF